MKTTDEAILAMKAHAFDSITEIIGNPWEYCGDTKEEENMRIATLGACYGICVYINDLRDAMKKGEEDDF